MLLFTAFCVKRLRLAALYLLGRSALHRAPEVQGNVLRSESLALDLYNPLSWNKQRQTLWRMMVFFVPVSLSVTERGGVLGTNRRAHSCYANWLFTSVLESSEPLDLKDGHLPMPLCMLKQAGCRARWLESERFTFSHLGAICFWTHYLMSLWLKFHSLSYSILL